MSPLVDFSFEVKGLENKTVFIGKKGIPSSIVYFTLINYFCLLKKGDEVGIQSEQKPELGIFAHACINTICPNLFKCNVIDPYFQALASNFIDSSSKNKPE